MVQPRPWRRSIIWQIGNLDPAPFYGAGLTAEPEVLLYISVKMFRSTIVIGLSAILFGLAFPVCGANLNIGDPVPALTLPSLQGKNVELSSLVGSKPTLIAFWTTWSKSCQAEISFLQSLENTYGEKLNIIGISLDRKAADVEQFIAQNNITFTVLVDKKQKYLDDFRVLIIPTLFVVGKDGSLKNIYVDFEEGSKKSVSDEVRRLL